MTSGKHAIAVLAAACAAAAGFSWRPAAQNRDPAQPRLVWAAKPVPPNERWHRATFHGTGMATRLAITPRNKEGQVHYFQPDVQGDTPSSVGSAAQVRTPDQMLINPDPKDWVGEHSNLAICG